MGHETPGPAQVLYRACGVGSLRHNPRLLPRPLVARSRAHPPRRLALLPPDQTTLDRAALRRGIAAMVSLRRTGPPLHWRGPHRGVPSLHRTLFPLINTRRVSRLRFRSEEHTSELQSRVDLVCRLLLDKK